MKTLFTSLMLLFIFSLNAQVKEEVIFQKVEEMPRFPGCEDKSTKAEKEKCSQEKLMQYIYTNLQYPEKAKKNDIQGRVVVRFIIKKNGRISDVKVIRDIGGGCGEEAKRIILSMNDMDEPWIPGRRKGRLVKIYYTVPVIFRLHG